MSADNPLAGEASFVMNGRAYTVEYDWMALSRLAKAHSGAINLFEPETLTSALAIGLRKHHPDITSEFILEASPPLIEAIQAFNVAMQRAYFGNKEPPKDTEGNPLMAAMTMGSKAASTESPSPSSSPSEPESSLPNSGN